MVGIPGLDRAAMERERLNRQAAKANAGNSEPSTTKSLKRDRSISPPLINRPNKAAKLVDSIPSNRQQVTPKSAGIIDLVSSSPVQAKKPEPFNQSSKNAVTSSAPALQYPNGVIKKTWALGHSRTGSDIKIEEVLERSTLRTALLSAFQWDVEWILSKCNLQQTKFIFVMQAKTEDIRKQYQEETEYMRKILRLCFPSMEGSINCMHSKLMLLFHPHKLRIVVPTANLVSYDWGETGVMENSVFLIDLPRRTDQSAELQTPFAMELYHFLQAMGCPEDVLKGFTNFDFGATEKYAFIHSIGGMNYDLETKTGYTSLIKSIDHFNLSSTKELQLDIAASSIGSLNDEYLKYIHSAARGQPFKNNEPSKPSRSAPKPFPSADRPENIKQNFRIYFPTHSTVASSTGGTNNGGTVCLQRKWFEGNNTFPRSCFRDYKSTRQGLLSHNKIIYARGQGEDGEPLAWAYVGSANLSESAWGKLSWDRSKKDWKMTCRNWECGILVPVLPALNRDEEHEDKKPLGKAKNIGIDEDAETESEDEGKTGKEKIITIDEDAETDSDDEGTGKEDTERVIEKKLPDMKVFKDILDMPFEYPGREYGAKQPWYFME